MYSDSQPTSFFKIMLDLVVLAHHVSLPNVNSVVILGLTIIQLRVELVGRRVKGVSTWVLLVTVVIIKNGGLTYGHSNDRASMLVCVSRAPVAVTALGSKQNRRNVVDLMGGLGTGTLLGDTTALAPSVACI